MRGLLITALVLGASTTALAQDRAAQYDDAFAFFKLDNGQRAVDGVNQSTGWTITTGGRMVGADIPRRSGLRYTLKQGSTTLGTSRCELGSPFGDQYQNIWVVQCEDGEQRYTAEGEITIEVHFVDGGDDSETLVATHTIEVLQVTRVRGTGAPDATRYYINRAGEILNTVIAQIDVDGHAWGRPELRPGTYPFSGRHVELTMMAADRDDNEISEGTIPRFAVPGAHARCTVNGERIAIERDDVLMNARRNFGYFHTNGRGHGPGERIPIHYEWYVIALPITWGPEPTDGTQGQVPGFAKLEDHPGRWSCDIRHNGRVIRSVAFNVADGQIQPHAEEAAGFTIQLNGHLADTTIPADSVVETRVSPDHVRRRGIGYGHRLQTEQGQATVNALPTIGEATLPQPRAGRRGRSSSSMRGRRGSSMRRRRR